MRRRLSRLNVQWVSLVLFAGLIGVPPVGAQGQDEAELPEAFRAHIFRFTVRRSDRSRVKSRPPVTTPRRTSIKAFR